MHAKPWAFGSSQEGRDALWQQGVNAEHLKKRAIPHKESDPPALDTSKGIDSALSDKKNLKKHKRDDLGVSWDRERTAWNSAPNAHQDPDERVAVESRHRVRAFADVETSEDLSISVGPELILKDKQNAPYAGHSDQPDSSVGMGMQFKLDF